MDNQVVKLELPSGGSEIHIASISKPLEKLTFQPGTYKSGDLLAVVNFTLSISANPITKLGFKVFDILNTYIYMSTSNEVKNKLTYQISYSVTSSPSLIMGRAEILCKVDIETSNSFECIPTVYCRGLLSNVSVQDGTFHSIQAS